MIEYYLNNSEEDVKSIIEKKLNTTDLEMYFQKLLILKQKSEISKDELLILTEQYKNWKLFKKLKKITIWNSTWVCEITDYLNKIGIKAIITTNEKTIHLKKEIKTSFGDLLQKIPLIRKILNLNSYNYANHKDEINVTQAFERLNLRKNVDADFSLESTFFTAEEVCLGPQVTPFYLKTNQKNTLEALKVYRRQNVDSTHLCEFYQLEYVREYFGSDPAQKLIQDFKTIFKLLGLNSEIIVRPTRNNYTWPSYEFFVNISGNLVEIGNSGIMDPLVLKKSGNYNPNAAYLAGAVGLERIYSLIYQVPRITEVKNDVFF